MNFLKNLKFVRKIQSGFLILGIISAIVAFNSIFQISKMSNSKSALFSEFIDPKEYIDNVYLEFQKIQFIMLKFSIPEFQADFQNNVAEYNYHKEKVDLLLDSLSEADFNQKILTPIADIKIIWEEYKNIVADAIISASASQTYDMAAVIATSSGEDVGNRLVGKFDEIFFELEVQSKNLNDAFSNAENDSYTFLIIGMATGTLFLIFTVFYLAPMISKPINAILKIFDEFSIGNFDINIQSNSKDEFGLLMNKAATFKNSQIEKIVAAQKIAEGSLENVREASDKDTLAQAFNKEVAILKELLGEIDKLLAADEKGDLSFKLDTSKFSGGWARILEGLNKLRASMLEPINEARSILGLMAEGDFTEKMKGSYKGDYENIKNDVNKVSVALNNIIGQVKYSADDLASSAEQISSSTVEMAAGASEQSSQTYEVVSSIEEMTHTIHDSSKNASVASKKAHDAGEKARNGGKVVEETIEGINRIADVVTASAVTIQELGKSSDQIGEIIQVINEIADQTNLLALNAAIEAARAGEHGRGFAVVADEVRKLAERTTGATNEITSMIQRIQEDTSGAVAAIEKGKKEVEKGKELAGDAGKALREIISNTDEVSSLITQLATASEQQNATSQQISSNIELINNVTQQSTESTEQISRAAENLNQLTINLQNVVNQFKLDSSSQQSNGSNKRSNVERQKKELIDA
jgi:methyl-accepting chemotaxis protein